MSQIPNPAPGVTHNLAFPAFQAPGQAGALQTQMTATLTQKDLAASYVVAVQKNIRVELAARQAKLQALIRNQASIQTKIADTLTAWRKTITTDPEKLLESAFKLYNPAVEVEIDVSDEPSFSEKDSTFNCEVTINARHKGSGLTFRRSISEPASPAYLALVAEYKKSIVDITEATNATSTARAALANMPWIQQQAEAKVAESLASQDPNAKAALDALAAEIAGKDISELIDQIRAS